MKAYKVELEMTNCLKNTVPDGKGYLEAKDSCIIVIAIDVKSVGIRFPNAKRVEEIGFGYFVHENGELTV